LSDFLLCRIKHVKQVLTAAESSMTLPTYNSLLNNFFKLPHDLSVFHRLKVSTTSPTILYKFDISFY